MSGWLRKLFRRFDTRGENQTDEKPGGPISLAADQTGHEVPQSLIENQADIQNEIAAGSYTTRLVAAGMLPERIAAELARLLAIDQAGADRLVAGVPVVLSQNIAEDLAYKIQRDLQMFGAVVDVYTNIEDEVTLDNSATSNTPGQKSVLLAQKAEEDPRIERTSGEYQVYIRSLGPHPEQILPFLQVWLEKYQTLPAARYRVEQDINQVKPTFLGLSEETAAAVASYLSRFGVDVAVYHEEDDARPQYDHNRYGVELVEVGPYRQVVIETLIDLLIINENEAQKIADSSPRLVLENVSVEKAIAAAQRLSAAGARCDLPTTRSITILDFSTADIPRLSGSYLVILHRTGGVPRMVSQMVQDLLPTLTNSEVQAKLDNTPCVILSGIALETAEMIKIRLSDFGATVVIQSLADRRRLGQEIHPQNPDFREGPWQVRIDSINKYRKTAIIKELRELLPGLLLQEIIALIETIPCLVVDGVDQQTAQAVQDRLQGIGAVIALQSSPSAAGAETIEIPGGNL